MTKHHLIDFNEFKAGTVIDDELKAKGVTVSTTGGTGDAVIFDTANPTGGDHDLRSHTLKKALIIQEKGAHEPDDNADGGMITFDFDGEAEVKKLTVKDPDEPVWIMLFDEDGKKIKQVDIRGKDGEEKTAWLDTKGVAKMVVKFEGSGAIDNIEYKLTPTAEKDFIVEGGNGNDRIDVNYTGDPEGDRVDANDNQQRNDDDVIKAGGGRDTINAGDGNDTIFAGTGDDEVQGGSGNDRIYGESGRDWIQGGGGNDHIYGQEDDDKIKGDDGNDFISGDAGRDTLFGGDGHDTVKGGDSDDKIEGNDGNDTLEGNAGQDTIAGGAGRDKIDGGSGHDRIEGNSGADTIYGGSGNDTITGYNAASITDGNVHPIADDGAADSIRGGDGHDRLYGGKGNDTLNGDEGNDQVFGGDDDDLLEGGRGHDTLDGGSGNDKLLGGSDNDLLKGGDGNDDLRGGTGQDKLEGGRGNDRLEGQDGADRIYGGDDADTIVGGTNGDHIDGGTGGHDRDVLDLRHVGPFRIVNETTDQDKDSTSGTVELLNGQGHVTSRFQFKEIETILGDPVDQNRAPVARDDMAMVESGEMVVIDVLKNDTDPDGDSFKIVKAVSPKGKVEIVGDQLKFTPNDGFVGHTTVDYIIEDEHGLRDTAWVMVQVKEPETQTPDAVDDMAMVESGDMVVIDVLANDSDPDGDDLTITKVTSPKGKAEIV
ncbi:MAG: Ig-like domain-containing protein, partial [Shimia sp.]